MSITTNQGLKPLYVFLILLAILSAIFDLLIIYPGKGELFAGAGSYMRGLMWCPGIAGILTALICKIPITSFGWKWGKTRYQIWSLFGPFCYLLVAYLIIWIVGWGTFYDQEALKDHIADYGMDGMNPLLFIFIYVVLCTFFDLAYSASTAIGEEIGWRGFLYSQLAERKLSYTQISLVTGVLWSAWHIPVLVNSDYSDGAPATFAVPCFIVMVMGLSFIFTYFRMRSGSLWTGVILHASHNMYESYFFTPFTKQTAESKYYIGEFGIVLAATCFLVAIGFWVYSRRSQTA